MDSLRRPFLSLKPFEAGCIWPDHSFPGSMFRLAACVSRGSPFLFERGPYIGLCCGVVPVAGRLASLLSPVSPQAGQAGARAEA